MKANKQMLSEISQLKQEILKQTRQENEEIHLYTDLTGLYVDIINAISVEHKENAPKIHYYANLIEQEIQFYSPIDAYIAGINAKEQSEETGYLNYRRAVAHKIAEQKLDFEIQTCFDELATLLGDQRDLIDAFTDVYRDVHGAIVYNISVFFKLGQSRPYSL